MKKNEKFLALLLSVVMILTCFVGTVTVNAENATPTATIVVTADAVEVGATEIPVTLTVTSETGINEALIKVSSDLGDIIAQPTVEANTPADADNTEGAANYNAFYLSARNVDDGTGNTTLGAITTATIKVVFTRTEAIVAGTYNVDVEIPEGKVIAASKDEVAIKLECTKLEIVVAEQVQEHVCTAWGTSYLNEEDGKWYQDCLDADCDKSIEVEANVDTVMGISRSIILADKIGIKFAVQTSAQTKALAKYDDYFIRIVTQSYDGSYNLSDVSVDIASDDTYDANASLVSYSYMNLTSYELTVPVNSTIYYLKDGKIVACSKTYTDTLNSRAMTFAKKFDYSDLNSASAKEGAMYLNLIKYGMEAQKYFAEGKTTADIYTAELPSFEEGYEAYVTTEVPELIETKSNVKSEGITAAMSRNVVVGASNALLYKLQIKDTTIPSTADLSKLYLEVSYTSSTDKIGTVTETVALSDLELVSGTYRYNFEKVAIYDLHRKVTAKLYSIDDPEKALINNTYSVESDAIKNINNGTSVDFWKAMAIFGHSALDFFGYSTTVE